jgi:hypothetical protein
MQSENFLKAERYRRMEKYNRRMKEKYLRLFMMELECVNEEGGGE